MVSQLVSVPQGGLRQNGIARGNPNPVQLQSIGNVNREPTSSGLFIRHRANATSVRQRRRKTGEDVPSFSTPVQVPKRYHRLSGGDFEDNWEMENQRNLQRMKNYRPRAYSEDWDALSDDELDTIAAIAPEHDVNVHRNVAERKSISGLRSHRKLLTVSSPMETLDRRISVSTEQLDTLKRNKQEKQSYRGPARARSASRQQLLDNIEHEFESENLSPEPVFHHSESSSGDSSRKSVRKSQQGFNPSGVGASNPLRSKLFIPTGTGKSRTKTALEKFLDEGPYSRRLYGPPPPELSSSAEIDEERRKRTRSHEYLESEVGLPENSHLHPPQPLRPHINHPGSAGPTVHFKEDPNYQANHNCTNSTLSSGNNTAQKKGLLWQQRDKLFSRWKERYFILTKDYFHCFKKGSLRMTEMGGFIFKLKLLEIDSVDLLDKRGYLTICISLLKEGKIYLRRPEGIKDWYTTLQTHIYDCKRKRKFWVDPARQLTDSSGIQQWLLSRQKVGGGNHPMKHMAGVPYPFTSSNPNIVDTSSSGFSSSHSGSSHPESTHTLGESGGSTRHHHPPPFTISRSQILDKNGIRDHDLDDCDDDIASNHDDDLHLHGDADDEAQSEAKEDKFRSKLPASSHKLHYAAAPISAMIHDHEASHPSHLFPSSRSSSPSPGPRILDSGAPGTETRPTHNCHVLSTSQPRGINRMSLVNELILKEQMATSSSASSSGGDPTSKSGRATIDECSSSDMDISTTNKSSSSQPNKSILRIKKLSDDSGHDSGHNSMHTNSSDSYSDGGSGEDHLHLGHQESNQITTLNLGAPSMINGGTTSVVTINGTSVKQTNFASMDDSMILSSDISTTPAELRASKSNFNRFRDKPSMATSSLRNPLYRKTYTLGQVITDL